MYFQAEQAYKYDLQGSQPGHHPPSHHCDKRETHTHTHIPFQKEDKENN
jgi:hypothetical protein